jgi:hypothetical protein
VWSEAAKWLAKFDDAVLTMTDVDGYPVSVRVDARSYSAATGELPAVVPDSLRPTDGPAGLLCHYHDEKLWGLQFVHVAGRAERRAERWAFVSTTLMPPPKGGFLGFARSMGTAATRYLAKRGLERPTVDCAAIKEIQRRAKRQRTG